MQNVLIKITGCVQRVGFRYSAGEMASRCNVRGYVMNTKDATVLMEAEGEAADVEAFVQWCRKGPPGSKVNFLDCTPGEVKGFTSFEIR